MIDGGSRISYELTADQRSAAAAAEMPGTVIIIGPVGSGRTRTAEEIAIRALARRQRVMVAGPLFGLQAFERRLHDAGGWRTFRVDLRALAARTPIAIDEPGEPTIAIVAPDLLRHALVRERLAAFGPAVIIADDLDLVQRDPATLVCEFANTLADSALVITAEDLSGIPDWARSEAASYTVASLHGNAATIVREVITFDRSEVEADLIARLPEVLDWLQAMTALRYPAETVNRAIGSSWAAVERSLLRFRRRLERSAYAAPNEETWELGDEVDVPDLRDVSAALDVLDELLTSLDSLVTDTKLTALLGSRLSPVAGNVGSLCVVSSQGATAEYLAEAIGEVVTSLPFMFLRDSRGPASAGDLGAFRSRGGICVITDRALQVYDLGDIDAFVHYDVPTTRRRLARRAGRLNPVGARSTTIAAILEGRPPTFGRREWDLLRADGFGVEQS